MVPDTGTPQHAYSGGELGCEGVAVAELAERFGTPLYVYSRAAIEERYAALRHAFGGDAVICYAVKSNPNLSLLTLVGGLGAGFDIVSGGELRRLQRVGIGGDRVVFAGVGKEEWEIRAALEAGVLFFNVEHRHEVELLEALAEDPVAVAVRVNPDVATDTHGYIATGRGRDKFGLDRAAAAEVLDRLARSAVLEPAGLHVHLGSQLRDPAAYLEAFSRVEDLYDRVPGARYYDLGGGFAVGYGDPRGPMDVSALAAALRPRLAERGLTPVLEPGRYLVADAGVLVTRVLGTKRGGDRVFAIVDAAMNDLIRPALYRAEHPVGEVRPRGGSARYDVVGPVCESGDFLARDRELGALRRGDLLAVFSAGAYGMAMASSYNTRRRAAEVLVSGDRVALIRRRERFEDLWATEVDL